MNHYEMLVADIDGTVVDHNSDGSEIHQEHPSKQAVDSARQQGKIITVATGRNYDWAQSVITAFEICSPVIVNSGSRIVDPQTKAVLWEQRLTVADARHIIQHFHDAGLNREFAVGLGHRQEVMFDDIQADALQDLIYLDLIGMRHEADIESVVACVDKLPFATVAVLPSPQSPGNKNVIVTHSGGTKYHALVELQAILGISREATIVIGDGGNDLPLFKAGGLKIAVDNASDALKQAADVTVRSVHEHGIVEAIETYLTPQS